MTKEEFDQKGFEAGDIVEITFIDGSTKQVTLSQGQAYAGHPGKSSYTGNSKGMKEVAPSIAIINPLKPQGDGIPLNEVFEVKLIKKAGD